MLTVIANNENSKTISIPADELEKLGINDGDEVEFSKQDDEIILRSVNKTERQRRFEKAKNEIFEEWHEVFVELAKGVDDKTIKPNSKGKFVLSKASNDGYKFVLQEANGKIIFESSNYNSRQEAQKAIDSLKKSTVEVELETA